MKPNVILGATAARESSQGGRKVCGYIDMAMGDSEYHGEVPFIGQFTPSAAYIKQTFVPLSVAWAPVQIDAVLDLCAKNGLDISRD